MSNATASIPQFIQRQELPTQTIKFSLPDEVLLHQKAVLHYLRQYLLQPEILFHPKYQDPACRFMDYTMSIEDAQPMIDCNTFLSNKSPGYLNADKGAGMGQQAS